MESSCLGWVRGKVGGGVGSYIDHCFSLCISAWPFISKLPRRKLLLIQARFVKKYFQIYERAVRKITFNFRLT